MSEQFSVGKLEAANRQLNVAIRMLFDRADPIAVHTLIGAASNILSDLMMIKAPEKSWDKIAMDANKLALSDYFKVMRAPQNFFKHARDDHTSTLDFNPCDTEALAFWATMNASELAPLSIEAQVYQLWYIAARSPYKNPEETPLREAIQLFGDLRPHPHITRLQAGKSVLARELQHYD